MVQREIDRDLEVSLANRITPNDGVKVLLVGDPHVGKSSIIHSLVNDEFKYDLPPKLDAITIPADITPDHVPIHIRDYSERDASHTDGELCEATNHTDVVCIVYTAGEYDSLLRVAHYWIPTVRRFDEIRGSYRPIILVANKIDLLPESSLSENIATIRKVFLDVETHIEVSALTQKNIVELFSSAQKAYTYPIAPLFNLQTRTLTKKCKKLLIDIFKQIDIDNDGLLNDSELNAFQENCFGTPLQSDARSDLKQIIKQSIAGGVVDNAITQEGFLFVHELSIDKGRRDFTWQVLRKYNYDSKVYSRSPANESSLITNETMDETGHSTRISTTNDESNDNTSQEVESLFNNSPDEDSHLSGISSKSVRKGEKTSREIMNALDFPWLRQNPIMFKAGVGITVTTFISFIALRYLSSTKA